MAQAGTVWVDVRGDMSQFATDVAEGAKKASAGMAGVAASGVKTVMGDIARSSAVAATALGVGGIAAMDGEAGHPHRPGGLVGLVAGDFRDLDDRRVIGRQAVERAPRGFGAHRLGRVC